MIKNSFCCSHCFDNRYIQQFIEDNYDKIGKCPYCKSVESQLITLEKMGIYLRNCIEKAYEKLDAAIRRRTNIFFI